MELMGSKVEILHPPYVGPRIETLFVELGGVPFYATYVVRKGARKVAFAKLERCACSWFEDMLKETR